MDETRCRRVWTMMARTRYIWRMAKHSLAEAEGHLAELIDRAQRGEEVVITRDEEPVAEIKPLRPAAEPRSRAAFLEALDRLAAFRAAQRPVSIDSGTLVRQMRDEDEH
jgi:prevent-host-death family protein